jgi:hypothetical protein
MLDLETIKTDLAAATPGPWCAESDWPQVYSLHPDHSGKFVASGLAGARTKANKVPNTPPNMTLIANTPSYLTALVAEVQHLRLTENALRVNMECLAVATKDAWHQCNSAGLNREQYAALHRAFEIAVARMPAPSHAKEEASDD